MDIDFIKDKFVEKHKIDDESYLDMYINFLSEYNLVSDGYTENHHILPISVFPEFKNEDWNTIRLSYEDHRLVHLWLFKSINIKKYQRPLNWMVRSYKSSKEISNASKHSWESFKKDTINYDKWIYKRSIHMKGLSSEEQRRRANIFWKNISDEEYINFCRRSKEYWTDIKKDEKSNQMKKFYENEDNIIKKRIEAKKHWNSMPKEDRDRFKEKMNSINKDISKREDAGIKIKNLWKSEDYLNKMRNRKFRSGVKIKLIDDNDHIVIFDSIKTFVEKYNISEYMIRKYKDTGNKITIKNLSDDNISLLNCKIETIK
jgi:hypothetical protein